MTEAPGFRSAAMQWLDERRDTRVDFSWLSTFTYDGERVLLMDRQRGIRKAASGGTTLSDDAYLSLAQSEKPSRTS